MKTPRILAVATAVALIVAGCSSGEEAPEPAASSEQPDGADTGAAGDGNDSASTEDDGSSTGDTSGGATLQLGDQTYEATTVLDCTVDDPIAPNDRQFVGESEDGTVRISISYFEDDALAGLTGLDVEIEGPDGDVDWSSSYVGADGVFTIEQRADGADGTAEISRLQPGDEPSQLTADWSFTC